jgi:hypothetical protein
MTNDIATTKVGIILGSITASLTLADMDLILAIVLKAVSIISFTIVIALSAGKLYNKVKEWIN